LAEKFKKNKISFYSSKIPRGAPYSCFQDILKQFPKLIKNKEEKKETIRLFENSFSGYMGANYAITFPYARVALYFILKAFNFPAKTEIITAPVTISDIINMIVLNNLKPVFADLGYNTANLDPDEIEKNITSKTRAILITHLNGVPSDMESILNIAKKHNLIVLEDASQSIGAKYQGGNIGLLGDVGFFSTSTLKPLSTFVGAMVVTNNSQLAQRLKVYSSNLPEKNTIPLFLPTLREAFLSIITNRYIFSCLTFYLIKIISFLSISSLDHLQHLEVSKVKRRLAVPGDLFISFTAYQAEVGLAVFKKLERDMKKISSLGRLLYSESVRLSIPGLVKIPAGSSPTFWRFPLWVENPKKIRKYLLNKYIDTTISNLDCCSRNPIFKEFNKYTPEAFKFMDNVIFLPIHPAMEFEDVRYMAKAVKEYYD
jgi:dTDP-4-amino-4,6-dideoxygalactose transaminase